MVHVKKFFLQYSKGHNSETKKGGTIIFLLDTLSYISIKYYEYILKIVHGRTEGQTVPCHYMTVYSKQAYRNDALFCIHFVKGLNY